MILITAPLDSESGYGHKAREIVKPIALEYWDETRIAFLPWGQTPRTGLDNPEYEFLKQKRKRFELKKQPELHIHVGLPTEFKANGEKNLLFTSGVESDRISPKWIKAINERADTVVVPSSYAKNIIENTSYEDRKGKKIEVDTPVRIVPESYSRKLLSDINEKEESEIINMLSHIEEDQWFVTYGQISEKFTLGAERKNVSTLVQEFTKEFAGNKGVALILKCNPTNFSELGYYSIKSYIERAIKQTRVDKDIRPPVYIIEGYLSHEQLFYLMNHDNVVSHVTATHGEGFGRFLLEASLSGKPMIVPKVGSFRDFLSGESVFFVDGEFEKVPSESLFRDTIIRESQWYDVDKKELRNTMSKVYKNYRDIDGSKLAKRNKEKYNIENIESQILDIVDDHYIQEVDVSIPEI